MSVLSFGEVLHVEVVFVVLNRPSREVPEFADVRHLVPHLGPTRLWEVAARQSELFIQLSQEALSALLLEAAPVVLPLVLVVA